MIKWVVTIFLGLSLAQMASGQAIEWTAFENLGDSLRKEKKPIMVFIHTSWCKYCKLQENTTFTDSALANILFEEYYCIRLNAETNDPITFLGREYVFQKSSGIHELAKLLGYKNGQLLFPTTVFLSQNLEVRIVLQGLQQASDLIKLVQTEP